MNPFIKKHQYNYIKRCLYDLSNTYKTCSDSNVIEAFKSYTQEKILSSFNNLTEEQKSILAILSIAESSHIDKFLSNLDEYVFAMPIITAAEISKLFKKEKKLKLPKLDQDASKNVYLGWIDSATNKMFIAYNMDGKLIGMTCRITSQGSNKANICSLCNCIHVENEVLFVSPVCKTSNSLDGYKSIGFSICSDSLKCNDRIESLENLEKLLKEVNNIK